MGKKKGEKREAKGGGWGLDKKKAGVKGKEQGVLGWDG